MKSLIVTIIATVLSFSDALSQKTTSDLEGWITDSLGKSIESVNIEISSPSLIGTRGTATNREGYFIIPSIPPGNYTVVISSVSFRRVVLINVTVMLDRTTSLGIINLEPEAIGLEEIIVEADRSDIDISSTSYGQNFKDDDLALLPLERDYQQISGLNPEAKESYLGDGISIAGASGKENKFFIDGVGVSDPFANWFATELPYNFVRELQINTGAYEPEFESSLGGLVNVITNSGSNEFFGKAFAFFTNDKFTGNTISIGEPSKGSFIQSDIGFGIGGPIIRDRLWFFISYNAQIDREELLVSNLGYQNYSRITNLFAGKLTWSINAKNKIEIVSFGDPMSGNTYPRSVPITAIFENFNVKPTIYEGNLHASIRGNHNVSKDVLLDSYLSISRFEQRYGEKQLPEITDPLFYDITTNTITGNVSYDQVESDEIKLGLKSTFLLNNHILKAGIEFLNSNSSDNADQLWIIKYGDSYFVQSTYASSGTVTHRVPTLFLQDSWLLNNYLRFNFGVRWNYVFMIGSNRKVAQEIPDQIAPRFGLIFLPEGNNKQKLSISLGRFYHTFPVMLSNSYYSESKYASAKYFEEDPRTTTTEGETIYETYPGIYPEIDDLRGTHYDEVTLGYKREMPFNLYGDVRLIYRRLTEGIEDGIDPETGEVVLGNPGKGDMSAWPEIQREYTALEIILSSSTLTNFNFQLSYILSRLYGNYTGFYDTDGIYYGPINPQYDTPEQLVDGTGLLPHDRTHTLKFFGSYHFDFGLSVGTSFFISSGKPLSIRGGHSYGPPYYRFLQQRGTNGRTPTVWDLNFRLAYELNRIFGFNKKIRFIADILHVASKKAATDYDEIKYFTLDENGNQTDPNPNYGQPRRFQPPMSLRLGIEVDF